tara:strand:+ start:56 stop:469 length:414 start_codon:yes stop_codon:yes gene_type:complete
VPSATNHTINQITHSKGVENVKFITVINIGMNTKIYVRRRRKAPTTQTQNTNQTRNAIAVRVKSTKNVAVGRIGEWVVVQKRCVALVKRVEEEKPEDAKRKTKIKPSKNAKQKEEEKQNAVVNLEKDVKIFHSIMLL